MTYRGWLVQRPGIYFPFIHVRDDSWLKGAALYWPSIHRLVPAQYQLRDSQTAALLADANVLLNEDPADLTHELSWDLSQVLESNEHVLRAHFALDQAESWRSEQDRRHGPSRASTAYAGNRQDPLGYIHVTKFQPQVLTYLEGAGLAKRGRGPELQADFGSWVGLHPALAGAYMASLAMRLSEAELLEPLTDQSDLRVSTANPDVASGIQLLAGTTLPTDGAPSIVPTAGVDTYVMMALEVALPAGLGDVPVETIVQLREKLAEEIENFRAHVDAQQAELARMATARRDSRRMELFRGHVNNTIKRPLETLEKGLKLSKLQPIRSLLLASSFSTPAAIDAGLTGLDTAPVVVAGAGVAFGIGTAWWQVEQQRHHAVRESPVGFLLDIREEMTPKTFAARARRLYKGTYA